MCAQAAPNRNIGVINELLAQSTRTISFNRGHCVFEPSSICCAIQSLITIERSFIKNCIHVILNCFLYGNTVLGAGILGSIRQIIAYLMLVQRHCGCHCLRQGQFRAGEEWLLATAFYSLHLRSSSFFFCHFVDCVRNGPLKAASETEGGKKGKGPSTYDVCTNSADKQYIRDSLKGLYMVARFLFQLILNSSAFSCLGPAYQII